MSLVSDADSLDKGPIKPFRDLLAAFFGKAKKLPVTDDGRRARRDFILTMMHEHPEAFQSELDVQYMMHMYPSRF